MANRYTATIEKDINSFKNPVDGLLYGRRFILEGNIIVSEKFSTTSPREMIDFLNALAAANPNSRGIKEITHDVIKTLQQESPSTPIKLLPQSASGDSPNENNPAKAGGDSGGQQAAPLPDVAVSVEATPAKSNAPPISDLPEPTRPPEGKTIPTHSLEQTQQQTNAGDPVDIFRGSFYLQEIDLQIPNTILPLIFMRFYRSGAASYGPFGWNWDHNYNWYVRELDNGDIALWRNLHEDIFKFDGVNFEPSRGVFEKLDRILGIGQTFELTIEGNTLMRFERPSGWIDRERIPLIWIKDRHGNKLALSYGADDKLLEVRDGDGRYLMFEYDQCGLLVKVSDQSGRKYEYEHDEQTMHLIRVKTPPISDHPNGIIKIYHYEQPFAPPELRHNITRVEDSQGNVYLENNYEQDPSSWDFSRVTEQLYGGFLYQFRYTQLQWVPENSLYINIPAVRVEVMNPDFGVETYTFNYRGDLLDKRYRLNKDHSFRVVVWQYKFDEQGNLAITTNPDGSQEINTYDFENPDPRMRGKLLRKEITAALGLPSPSRILWKAKYEPVYQLLSEEHNELGAITKYKYDFDITPGAITNSGKLIEIVHPRVNLPDGSIQNSKTNYEYNSKGQVLAIISPAGIRQEMIYGITGNEKSRLIKQIFDVGGLNVENKIKYDVAGFDTETIDGNSNSTQKVINSLGLVEKTILPPINGIQAEYRLHYDSDKKVVASERPKGKYADASLTGDYIVDKLERDVLGYPTCFLLSSNTSEKRIIKIRSDFRGFPIETLHPDGSKYKKIYDERGLLIQEESIGTDGLKLTSKKVYDRSGKLVHDTNKVGLKTTYEYDGFSRIKRVILPNDTQLIYRWLKGDLLESEEVIGEDGFGNLRQLAMKVYSYDEKGRKTVETVKSFSENPATAIDVTSKFFFDTSDRIEKIIDHRGGIKMFFYDGLGRLITAIDPMGNEEHNIYDNNGNLIQKDNHHKEPNGSVSIISKEFSYDARNRKIETIEPDGAIFATKYDDRNLLVGQTDYLGIKKEIVYDSYNNLIKEVDDVNGLSITQQWGFDNMSRVHTYIDPTGQISKYSSDSLGRNYKTEYPNGFSSTRIFNNIGQIKEEILSSGVKFEYEYDKANRLIDIKNTFVPESLTQLDSHQFMYDGLNRVITAKIGIREVIRKYDSLNRLLMEKNHGKDVVCIYDDNSGTVEKIWPDGRTEKYSHDLNGVITRIEETVNGPLGTGAPLIASIRPSGDHFLGEVSYQGGLEIANKYDERKRLIELAISSSGGVNERIKYRYDSSNKKRVEAFSGQKPKISYFEFDNKSRLTITKDSFPAVVADAFTQTEHEAAIHAIEVASAGATHEEQFEYNLADARTKYSETGASDKNYIYASGHKIQNDGTHNYNYFADGTLQEDGLYTYHADALGRVTTIKSGVNIICQIDYDAFGRPSLFKEMGRPEKTLCYLGGFVEQENENGIASRQISTHPMTGVPIAYHSATGTHYTFFDGRFNLIGIANTRGDLLETFRYKSFGSPEIYDTAGNTLVTSAFGIEPIFGGQKFLSSTRLYIAKRRLMNPMNGAFIAPDPKGYIDSPSLYIYAAQDPTNNIDPNGEVIPLIVAVFVIGGAFFGAGYSVYDAYHHPEKYSGSAGIWRPFANTFGGAAIGGVSVVAGEGVLAFGGAGSFATGTGATTLTAAETFTLYGASAGFAGISGRSGLNMFVPEYVDPVSPKTIAIDYFSAGGLSSAFRASEIFANRLTTWTLQGDREAILESGRLWGQTEGSVYGMGTPDLPNWRMTGGGRVGNNSAIFEFTGEENIFQPHEITGPFSLVKRVLGQRKAGFGDIAFEKATQVGSRTIGKFEVPIFKLSGVQLQNGIFAGQRSALLPMSRLWGRRVLENALPIAGGGLSYKLSPILADLISSSDKK